MATALAALVLAGSTACGDGTDADAAEAGPPTIVVTTSIWTDVVANVACEGGIDVYTVIPAGGDPHGFEPSLADRQRMESAAVVVANGLLLEEGLEDTLQAVEDAGTPVFRIGQHVDTIGYRSLADRHDEEQGDEEHDGEHDDGDHADEHDGHGHDGHDPHVWFDPTRVSAVLAELGDQLVLHAGLDVGTVDACIDDYRAALERVDAEIAEMVSAVADERRRLVTGHDALGYFADRYGFEVVGTVIPVPSGMAATNPAGLEELAVLIEATDVPAIFVDTQHSDGDARAVAARVGEVEVVTLLTGTLEDRGEAATYLGLLRVNAELITEALR